MGSNIELNVDDLSDERCYKNQGVGGSLVFRNSGLKKKQILGHSEGTLDTPSQKVSPSPLRSQLSKGVLEFEKAKPMTNDQILDFIEKEVALLKSVSRKKDDMERQRFSPVLNEQCTTTTGQEDNSDPLLPFELSPKSKEKCDISASEKHLTDDQHVTLEVAASCTTKEAESPVTITVGSGVTLPEKTEKYPGLMSSCSSSQGEFNRVKETPSTLSLLSKHVRWEREDISLKPVEAVGLYRVHVLIDESQDASAQKNIEDQQYCHVESKKAAELSSLDSLTDKIAINNIRSVTMNQSKQPVCNQTGYKNMEEDAAGVCLRADLSVSLPLNKVRKIAPPRRPEGEGTVFVAVLNDPQYEYISDAEDLSKLDMNLLNAKQEKERFADPSYEDVSEDENPQFQNMAEEMPLLPCEVPEANATQNGPVQSQAKTNPSLNEELIPKEQMSPKTETLDLAQHCSCPCFVESEDGFEHVLCPKCASEKWQTSHSIMPLSVTQHQEETEEAADEDNEWLVIPINVLDVKWEPADEDQADGENVSQYDGEHENQVKQSDTNAAVCEVPKSVLNQVPDAAFSLMEVFDTPSQQAKAIQSRETTLQSFLVPSSWGIPETKTHRPQNRESHCDPEDSCETEDSSDYSSDSERNYLTVSTQLLKNLSVPASTETDDSDSEKENEDHEMPNLQQCQTRGRSKSSGKDDIINLDSDTEDEGVQNCAETKTKRLFSTHTQNSGAACLSQLKKCSPETVGGQCGTVKENLQTNGLQSTDSPATQCQSRCYKEVIQTRNSHFPQRTEKYGHLLENKIGSHVKKESSAQNYSDDPSVIVIFDSEDEGKQSNRQVMRKGVLTSELMSGSSTLCGEQRKDNEKTASAKTKNREPSAAPADSSKSQDESKLQHMQLKEKRQDVYFSLSHSVKKRKLIKVRVYPEHVHQKPNRQITSKTVERGIAKNLMKNKTNVVSSETEDSDDALVNAQNSLCVSKKPQISLPFKDSSEKLPQSVDRDADSTKAHNEHFQQKGKTQIASKTVEREVEKDLKQKRKTRILSSEMVSDDTLIYAQTCPPCMDYPEKQPQSVDSVVDSIKVCHEHVQQKSNGHMTSKTVGTELEKDYIKQKRKTRVLSSETEDSDDTLIYVQTSLSSADIRKKHQQALDSDDDSAMAPNPVIPRFFVQKSSQSSEHLKLLEQCTVQRQGKNESQATQETPAETSKKTGSSKKGRQQFSKGIKGKAVYKSKPVSDAHHITPLPSYMHSSSSPREHSSSSKLQRSHSYSNSSTLNQSCTPTKGPSFSASMQSSAKEQVFSDWQKSFVPTRRDRKTSLENNVRTRNNCDSLREARPGPSHHDKAPRRRHSSYESVPPLMKRPKYEAIQITKARNRDTPWEQRFPVSEGYKWKNQADFMTNQRPGTR